MRKLRDEIREFREENNRLLSGMRADMTRLQEKLDAGFAEMRRRFDACAASQRQIADMVDTLVAQRGGMPDDRTLPPRQ